MPEYVGKMVICSRCGKEIFLKHLGTEDDWGHKRDKYEDIPEDWLNVIQLGGHLCEDCSFMFKKWVTEFMYGQIAPAWDVNYKKGE